jgi:hypothetical protein
MENASSDKVKVLAEMNGWSLARAEGFLDGESFRRRGKTPSTYAEIGIDEYCQGFRAGYYERVSLASVLSFPRLPMARPPLHRTKDPVESFDATLAPAQSVYE